MKPIRIRTVEQLRDLMEEWRDAPSGRNLEVELYAPIEADIRGELWDACKIYYGPERWRPHKGAYVLNDSGLDRGSTTVTVVGTFA